MFHFNRFPTSDLRGLYIFSHEIQLLEFRCLSGLFFFGTEIYKKFVDILKTNADNTKTHPKYTYSERIIEILPCFSCYSYNPYNHNTYHHTIHTPSSYRINMQLRKMLVSSVCLSICTKTGFSENILKLSWEFNQKTFDYVE